MRNHNGLNDILKIMKIKLPPAIILCSLLYVTKLNAQQNVGINTLTPNASAQLDISSTTKGLLVPRMNNA